MMCTHQTFSHISSLSTHTHHSTTAYYFWNQWIDPWFRYYSNEDILHSNLIVLHSEWFQKAFSDQVEEWWYDFVWNNFLFHQCSQFGNYSHVFYTTSTRRLVRHPWFAFDAFFSGGSDGSTLGLMVFVDLFGAFVLVWLVSWIVVQVLVWPRFVVGVVVGFCIWFLNTTRLVKSSVVIPERSCWISDLRSIFHFSMFSILLVKYFFLIYNW